MILILLSIVATSVIPHSNPVWVMNRPARLEAVAVPTTFLPQDSELTTVRALDRQGGTPDGKLPQLEPGEHIRRAGVYMSNRAFLEARAHYQAVVDRYPTDVNMPAALFGMGRTQFQVRDYDASIPFFERVAREFGQTKDGREGLYSLASSYLRLGRGREAAARYREYTEKYPAGERIEAAYMNVIEGLREGGRPAEAIDWIARTRQRFAGMPTATNALFARLRLDVAEGDWEHAVQTAEELRSARFSTKVATNPDEIAYLRAYSLERDGKTAEAVNAYLSIPDNVDSYYGWLATTRLATLAEPSRRSLVSERTARVDRQIDSMARLYPAPYREAIVREATRKKIDARLVLAIMRQESAFKPRAKSPAAARGLLQLTIDTASRYAAHAGLSNLRDEDLYRPETSILLGSAYLAELSRQFPNLPEAVAASYNGGEDNAERWVKRGKQRDPGVFAAEVGFDETKSYVYKVMAGYRAYKRLYTPDLRRR